MGIVYYYEFKNRSDLFENVKYLVYVAYFVCVPDPPPATTHLHQRQWSVPRGAPRIPSVLRRSRMLRVWTDWALDPPTPITAGGLFGISKLLISLLYKCYRQGGGYRYCLRGRRQRYVVQGASAAAAKNGLDLGLQIRISSPPPPVRA